MHTQTDRQTDRQTGMHRHAHTDRQTDRQTGTGCVCTDMQTDRHAHTHRQTDRQTPTWRLDSDVVIGIDAHVIPLQVERKLAAVDGLELMVVLQVRPAPQAAVDHMGQTLAMRDLRVSNQPSLPLHTATTGGSRSHGTDPCDGRPAC